MSTPISAKLWRRWGEEMPAELQRVLDGGPTLAALAEMSNHVDGYGTGGSGRTSKGEVSDPTCAAAAELLAGDRPDLVAEWIEELSGHMALTRGHLRAADRLWHLINHRGDERVGRQPAGGDCLVCCRYVSGSATDRLRRGMCSACYQAWWRWAGDMADPSLTVFTQVRRAELRADLPAEGVA